MRTIDIKKSATPLTEIQKIAQIEPVVITDGEKRQVLINYQDFLKMTASDNKPFVSLGEIFTNLPPEVAQALAQVEEDDIDLNSTVTG